ncbi:MAG: enoyl-CoA hydratase/isomerase family protein, partial [Vulcanimicrobiaceae bacterium]
ASHVLSRLPGALGLYLGLTGARLSAGDALAYGLATHFVGAHSLAVVADAITDAESIEAVLARYTEPPPASELTREREAIERCFDAPSVVEIAARVAREPGPWGEATAARLRAASPTSLALTFAMIRQARSLDMLACLGIDYLLAKHTARSAEFLEGVRAMVIDKDRNPAWNPATIEAVDVAAIDAILANATQSVLHGRDANDRVDAAIFAQPR